ncbi:CFEM domain protein [Aspergillus sclerotialis]|uniref:CFEM domain protein n=1 Tax=Aspergillus sclerotialis TaxID=2070753 RepID=A0A3A2ZTS9_9EURO|nr:CFEM domain protein [Aspergillus sclerotialis]
MKLHYFPLVVAPLLGTAAAQSFSEIPSCARTCATGSIPSSCNSIDVSCICSNDSFITDISCCVAKSCSKEDQDKTLNYAKQICAGAGVHDLPKSASCGSGASATGTAGGSNTETTASASTMSGATTLATASTTASTTESSSSSAESSSPTDANAATAFGQNKDSILAAVAGAAAFALLA